MIKKTIILSIISSSLLAGCTIPYQPVPQGYINDEKYEKELLILGLEEDSYNLKCKDSIKEYDCDKRKVELDEKMEKVYIPLVSRLNELNPELKFSYDKNTHNLTKEWKEPEKHKVKLIDMFIVDESKAEHSR